MNVSEKISIINELYKSVHDERSREGVSVKGTYLTIDDHNRLGVWQLATNTIFNENNLTICCVDLSYLSYGWKTQRIVFAIFDKEGNIISHIKLGQWGIVFNFIETTQPRKPIPEVELFLAKNPSEKIKLLSYSDISYQSIWDCLIEISGNCNTLQEASIYFKYFEAKTENRCLKVDFQQYRADIASKDNLINQYQTLIDSIKHLVEKQS